MEREEALKLSEKYDGEFPSKWLDDVLNYLELSEVEFHKIVDQHRNEEIWIRNNKNEWKLKWSLM